MLYQKGDKAKKGSYLNLSNGKIFQQEADGRLPDTIEGRFIRFPSALTVIAAPFVGLAYVVFLPFTGISAVFAILVLKIKAMARVTTGKRVIKNHT